MLVKKGEVIKICMYVDFIVVEIRDNEYKSNVNFVDLILEKECIKNTDMYKLFANSLPVSVVQHEMEIDVEIEPLEGVIY